MSPREKLLECVRDGFLDSYKVLDNLLMNWLSTDDANEFAVREYEFNPEDDED